MILAGREIKRIVASGCSFTYGEGLDDPKNQSWPSQLASKFDVECVNLAWCGMGNEHIHRTITDYFCHNKTHRQDSFVIPCFTSYHRIEFNSNDRQHYENPEWTTLPQGRIHAQFNKMFFDEMFIPDYYYARYIRIILNLQIMFKSWDIPYLMFEGISGNPHKDMIFKSDIKPLVDEIDRSNWLRFTTGNLDTMTDQRERLPDGHPNANAYREMSEILYKHLINKYATE